MATIITFDKAKVSADQFDNYLDEVQRPFDAMWIDGAQLWHLDDFCINFNKGYITPDKYRIMTVPDETLEDLLG